MDGFTDFLTSIGWWLIPLILVLFLIIALLSNQRKARIRQRNAELAAQRLLAESLRTLREQTPEQTAQTGATPAATESDPEEPADATPPADDEPE